MSTGLLASERRLASEEIATGFEPDRDSTVRSFASLDDSSASAVQSSIGRETNAGPFGGSEAVWIARAIACGTSAALGGS
jgi:hypothetical protein